MQLLQRGHRLFRCQVDKKIRLLFIIFFLCVSNLSFAEGTSAASTYVDEDDSSPLSSPIREDNRVLYPLYYEKQYIGDVEGYRFFEGSVVSVTQLFDALRLEYTHDKIQKRIFGRDNSNRWFMLSTITNKLRIEAEEIDYSSQEVYATDEDVFADVLFLNRFFDFELAVNESAVQMTIYSNSPLFEAPEPDGLTESIDSSKAPAKSEETAIPEEHTVKLPPKLEKEQTVAVEEHKVIPPQVPSDTQPSLQAQTIPIPQQPAEMSKLDPLVKAQPVVEQATQSGSTPPPTEKVDPDFDNILSFEVQVQELTYEELIDIYDKDQKHFYIPLTQLFSAVEFPIEIDPELGTAEGWFISEDKKFILNLTNKTVTINDKEYQVAHEHVFVYEDDIFVWHETINKWFPLNINPNFQNQALVLNPSVPLAFQARKEREKKRADLERRKNQKEKDFAKIDDDYQLIDWPSADVTLNSTYNRDSDKKRTYLPTYSSILAGDAAYLNYNAFVSGNEDELTSLRVMGKRTDIDGNLPGGLTEISVGDVSAINSPLVSGTTTGRGINFSSFPLTRASQFDSTVIRGDSLPGWEVELYSNNVLVEFQQIGDNGEYVFEDVPIFIGDNDIRLVFFGPQGEEREETRSFTINNAVIPEGDFHYSFSANERDRSLFKVGPIDQIEGRSRVVGKAEYGLTDRLTLASTTVYNQLDSENDHTYQSLGLATSFGPVVASTNIAHDFREGGWAAEFTANTRLWDQTLRYNLELFTHDYVNETNENDNDKDESISDIAIGGNFKIPYLPNVNYRATAEHTRRQSGDHVTDFGTRVSSSIAGVALSNNLNTTFRRISNTEDMTIDGVARVRGRIEENKVRIDMPYTVEPITEFTSVTGVAQRQISKDLNAELRARKDLTGQRNLLLSGFVNWNEGRFRLSNQATLNTDTSYSIGSNMSFSLYREPRSSEWRMQSESVTGSGALSTVAFLDANYNNVYDEGEEILEEVTFLRNNVKRKSDESGVGFVPGIGTVERTNVSIDANTLDDELWVPAKEGYAVLGRAGVIQRLDMPIYETSEIDGTVYFIRSSGREQTVSGLKLFLLTPEGKKVGETKTEFDGLYIFTKVLPGEYLVVVSEEELRMLGVKMDENIQVAVDMGGDIYSGYDVVLRKAPRQPRIAEAPAEPKKEEPQQTIATPAEMPQTPWPEDEPKTAQAEVLETPMPQYAEMPDQKLKEVAKKTALLPDGIPDWGIIYGLPKSRYSQYQLGIYAHQKRKSIEELEERFAMRKLTRDLYSSPITRFGSAPPGTITSIEDFYDRQHIFEGRNIEEKYADYTSHPRHSDWSDRLGQIEDILNLGVPVIGIHKSYESRHDIYMASIPKHPALADIDPVEDITDRFDAQKAWFGMESPDELNYRGGVIPAYRFPSEAELDEVLSYRKSTPISWLPSDIDQITVPTTIESIYRERMISSPTHSTITIEKSRIDVMVPEEYLYSRENMVDQYQLPTKQASNHARIQTINYINPYERFNSKQFVEDFVTQPVEIINEEDWSKYETDIYVEDEGISNAPSTRRVSLDEDSLEEYIDHRNPRNNIIPYR